MGFYHASQLPYYGGLGGFNNFNHFHPYYNNFGWGSPYTALSYANNWFPGWNACNWGFQNNNYVVVIKRSFVYKTVIITPNYGFGGVLPGFGAGALSGFPNAANINGGLNQIGTPF